MDAARGVAAKDRSLLWMLDHYWRLADLDGGVYAECEALVLARQIPVMLRWIADPLVARASRHTGRHAGGHYPHGAARALRDG